MTNDECRAEAPKRVQRSDGLFAEYQALPEAEKREYHVMYSEVSHLRQTAAVFAALAGPIDG